MKPAIALMTALLLSAPMAHADKAVAKEHYTKGMAAFTLENYDKAIAEFRAGFEEAPDPVFLFNIAQAYRLSNRPREAINFYKKYLHLAPEAKNRPAVEKQLAALEKSLGSPIGTLPPSGQEPSPANNGHASAPPPAPSSPAVTAAKTAVPGAAGQPAPPPQQAMASPQRPEETRKTATTPVSVTAAVAAPPTPQPATKPRPVETPATPHPAVASVPRAALPPNEPTKVAASHRRRWPIWMGVALGAVAAGTGVGLGVGLTQSSTPTLPLESAR
jgi:hypothetical protein